MNREWSTFWAALLRGSSVGILLLTVLLDCARAPGLPPLPFTCVPGSTDEDDGDQREENAPKGSACRETRRNVHNLVPDRTAPPRQSTLAATPLRLTPRTDTGASPIDSCRGSGAFLRC
jgi:hypothetical protein